MVCIIGHVNHGKTTLLDTLRGTKLASHEDGGITQDLYTYQCDLGDDVQTAWNNNYRRNIITRVEATDGNNNGDDHQRIGEDGQIQSKIKVINAPLAHTIPDTTPNKELDNLSNFDDDTLLHVYKKVTFLDTPGHASFFDMRENGTLFSDLVLLVVSAVEGVCPQTLESIEYIKEFKLPVVVALTKTDLPNANPNAVIQQLQQAGLNAVQFETEGAVSQLTQPDDDDEGDGQQYTRKNTQPKKQQVTPCIPISAISGQNMDKFKENIMKAFLILKPQAPKDVRIKDPLSYSQFPFYSWVSPCHNDLAHMQTNPYGARGP